MDRPLAVIIVAAVIAIAAIWRNVWVEEDRHDATATEDAWVEGRRKVRRHYL